MSSSVTLTQFVPLEDPVKIGLFTIQNRSGRPRRLAVFSYVEWALAATRNAGAPHIVTELDAQTRALFASNPHSDDFGSRIAFLDMGGRQTAWTGDRREFLGRNGGPDAPAALLVAGAAVAAAGRRLRSLRRATDRNHCWSPAKTCRSRCCWARPRTAMRRAP